VASIRVNTKEPFELVYSLYKHPQLGYLLEYIAVQLMPNGEYSLLSQKLHSNTAKDFGAPEEAVTWLKSIDETDPDFLIRKFFPSKKPVRQSDFFGKHYSPELHAKIRPYIEKRILKVLEKLDDRKIFLAKDKNFTHAPIEIEKEKAGILFHFRRTEAGTNYFATIKLGDQKISFSQNNSELIIQEPAWLLCNNRLITFKKDTDGNKIKPFLSKKFISIPVQSEEVYFEKFVKPLIENYDVYAEGFEIKSEQYRAFPILKLSTYWENRICASLYFNYGPYQFPYHSAKMVSVTLEKKGDSYIFHRVRRSKQWENIMTSILDEMGLKLFEGSLFITKDDKNLIELINKHMEELKGQGFVIDQSMLAKTYHLGESHVTFNISKQKDWFDLEAIVKFGNFQVPFIKLKQYILSGNREFILPDDSIAIIPDEWFTRFSSLFDFTEQKAEGLQIRKYHFGLLEGLFKEEETMQETSIQPFDEDVDYELPKNLKAELRPYQLTGYKWLRYMHDNGFGACLADDMGLGKTMQILTYLQFRAENKPESIGQEGTQVADNGAALQFDLFSATPHPMQAEKNETVVAMPAPQAKAKPQISMVIVPTSLIYNWQSEASKFTSLKLYVHTGFNRSRTLDHILYTHDLIITSYGTMRNDIELFSAIEFDTIVLDESQAIKNPASQTAICANQLRARQKFVMTGTPVENSITDLWSQINFLNPGVLGNYHFFTKKYVASIEKDKNEKDTITLKNIVRPFILRRTKEQVASDLPGKTEKIVMCEMTEEQKQKYESVKSLFRNELLSSINETGYKKSHLMILNGLVKLRQIANHPILSEKDYLGGSGKLDEVIESVYNVIGGGHKVLIFSQFVQHLGLLRDYFDSKSIDYLYIAGNIPSLERKKLVDQFQNENKASIFLISLKAGGTGLNLTEADYVFILDPWWNPAVERQAMDRTHRIGQTKPVFVYKFITRDTIEEKIVNLQKRKQKVSDDLLDTEEHFVNSLQEDTLKSLLE
jgi:SNF2 family DNA or RNA helicase